MHKKNNVKIAGYVEEQDVTCIRIQYAGSRNFFCVTGFITGIRINKIECNIFSFPFPLRISSWKKSIFAQIDNGRGIKFYPCLYVRLSICHTQRRPLSMSNSLDQNFMKLGQIVKYHNVPRTHF